MSVNNQTHLQRLEAAKKTLEELKTKRTRAVTLLERDRDDAEEAKKEALDKFKTSDLDELRKLRTQMLEDNERMTIAFETSVNNIAQKQNEVDQKLLGV